VGFIFDKIFENIFLVGFKIFLHKGRINIYKKYFLYFELLNISLQGITSHPRARKRQKKEGIIRCVLA
jgi:hypothetical protein